MLRPGSEAPNADELYDAYLLKLTELAPAQRNANSLSSAR
jgi:hypothetical protein